MEVRDVIGQHVGAVPLRIDGDEQRSSHLSLRCEILKCQSHVLQRERADVGTIGEAEEDQEVPPAEVAIRHSRACVGDRLERPPDHGRRLGRERRHPRLVGRRLRGDKKRVRSAISLQALALPDITRPQWQ
jgi:hypothetical protein